MHVLTYYYVAIYKQDNVIYTLCWSENKYMYFRFVDISILSRTGFWYLFPGGR